MADTESGSTSERATARAGESSWITFVLVLFFVVGVANVIWGIGALLDREYFEEGGFIFGTLTSWGWIAILWGAAQILVGFGLIQGSDLTRWVGVAVAGIGAVFWFLVFPLFPLFALMAIVLDVLVIYGLSARWED